MLRQIYFFGMLDSFIW